MTTKEELREYQHIWRLAFPEKRKAIKRRYDLKHFEECKAYSTEYRKRNPEIYRESTRRQRRKNPALTRERDRVKMERRRINDPSFRILENLRRRVNHALNGRSKSATTVSLLGCTVPSFRIYLESKFESGMSWENYGEWELDHIMPCAIFDLSKPEHQKRCFHFSNMQPLWANDNRVKSNSISSEVKLCL